MIAEYTLYMFPSKRGYVMKIHLISRMKNHIKLLINGRTNENLKHIQL